MTEEIRKELQIIATNIMNMDVPTGIKQSVMISKARQEAAVHLHKLGYSHRQIMRALRLKSPQAITEYLRKAKL